MYAWTMGTFDGLHRGHQILLRKLVKVSRERELQSLVFLFDLPPRLFFHPAWTPQLLTLPEERKALLKSLGVDRIRLLHFDFRLARMEPEYFLREYLKRRFRIQRILVGANFALGKHRKGTPNYLRKLCRRYKMELAVVPLKKSGEGHISSTVIREMLLRGHVEEAARLLGRPYEIRGEVVPGSRLGKKIGTPTANLRVHPWKILPPGVFAAGVSLGKQTYAGVCNIGQRPTLRSPSSHPQTKPRPEVHLFHFQGSLYGKELKVRLLKYIRSERRFPEIDSLRRQIEKDKRTALNLLNVSLI